MYDPEIDDWTPVPELRTNRCNAGKGCDINEDHWSFLNSHNKYGFLFVHEQEYVLSMESCILLVVLILMDRRD